MKDDVGTVGQSSIIRRMELSKTKKKDGENEARKRVRKREREKIVVKVRRDALSF